VVIGAEGSDLGDITLSARVQLEGLVVDTAGAPLGGVVVAIEEAGFDHYVYTATTDVQGAFTCNVPDTALIVRFMPSNDRGVAITPFSLPRPSEGPSTYPLGAGALIAGNASASGSPLPFAVIEVKSPSGESLGTTVTDTNGRYALRIAAP
jgi:protocatechuate 3,4-dioxygenase beta subunit